MDVQLQYLVSFLEEEFGNRPDVRIRVIHRSGTRRSPDLVQDYDPESSTLHQSQGVVVRAGQREYYFPYEWAAGQAYGEIQKLAAKIRDDLGEW